MSQEGTTELIWTVPNESVLPTLQTLAAACGEDPLKISTRDLSIINIININKLINTYIHTFKRSLERSRDPQESSKNINSHDHIMKQLCAYFSAAMKKQGMEAVWPTGGDELKRTKVQLRSIAGQLSAKGAGAVDVLVEGIMRNKWLSTEARFPWAFIDKNFLRVYLSGEHAKAEREMPALQAKYKKLEGQLMRAIDGRDTGKSERLAEEIGAVAERIAKWKGREDSFARKRRGTGSERGSGGGPAGFG